MPSKEKLLNYYPLLEILKNISKKKNVDQFQRIVSYLDDKSLKFLAECIRNILNPDTFKHLPVKKQKRLIKTSKPHKKNIVRFIKPSLHTVKRKKIIQEGGAWFLPLLTSIIPLFASLLKPNPQPQQ